MILTRQISKYIGRGIAVVFSLSFFVLTASCMYDLNNPHDQQRCEACPAGQVCFEGECVGGDAAVVTKEDGKAVAPDLFAPGSCVKDADSDKDGISDLDEHCQKRDDTDKDGTPDYLDSDSDNDGIPDAIEAGDSNKSTPPRDSDSDKTPDYLDVDSDNDGLLDKMEDINGDGRVGCCRKKCGETIKDCLAVKSAACGSGQKCTGGAGGTCSPAEDFLCSNGETNPTKKTSFPNTGTADKARGNSVCSPTASWNPNGLKDVQAQSSPATEGDWQVVLEKDAKYIKVKIDKPAAKMAAAFIDHASVGEEVAGFVLSRASSKKVQDEMTAILASINSSISGGASSVVVRSSGSTGKSHDNYETIQRTVLDYTAPSATKTSTVRVFIMAAMLGISPAKFLSLPTPWGTTETSYSILFTTIKRKDRLLIMGAVFYTKHYDSLSMTTQAIAEDLGNGSALAAADATLTTECDVALIDKLPKADIIWVMDESGSMSDNRADVVNHANEFFSLALSYGLDFRIGVTGVCTPNGSHKSAIGKFCSTISTNVSDSGGTDRFLLPTEKNIFSACINNPPGYEGGSEYSLVNARDAVKNHLPRTANSPSKIRTDAQLVIIVATDEIANSLAGTLGYNNTCPLSASIQSKLATDMAPYLNLFTGVTDSEAKATYHLIGGLCSKGTCSAQINHGHLYLVNKLGGISADICQKKLGPSLQQIVQNIAGKASPINPEYPPVSISLAVALDGTKLTRSRSKGFGYLSWSNSITFANIKYQKGSKVYISYRRWKSKTP